MKRIFLDTNVLLDFFLKRSPFRITVARLFILCNKLHIELCTSILSLVILYYFLDKDYRKRNSGDNPLEILKNLCDNVKPLPVDEKMFFSSFDSSFNDFEDGLQHQCAYLTGNIAAIITRNKKDFTLSKIPVFTHFQFVEILS